MELDLPLIWAGIIAIGVIMYVVMDGFDLGIGILFPFARTTDRDVMMNTVAPIWDGNETWLILGGTSLFAAFPIAYAVLLPAFYLPLMVMLLGAVFRGVAFEFRFKSRATAIGGIARSPRLDGRDLRPGRRRSGRSSRASRWSIVRIAGSALSWLDPFSLFCGLALMAGYAMLGAGWLIGKTEGPLQVWARGKMRTAACSPWWPSRRVAVDPADPRRDRRALVRLAPPALSVARAAAGGAGRLAALPAPSSATSTGRRSC